jgi:hypothetical protein
MNKVILVLMKSRHDKPVVHNYISSVGITTTKGKNPVGCYTTQGPMANTAAGMIVIADDTLPKST